MQLVFSMATQEILKVLRCFCHFRADATLLRKVPCSKVVSDWFKSCLFIVAIVENGNSFTPRVSFTVLQETMHCVQNKDWVFPQWMKMRQSYLTVCDFRKLISVWEAIEATEYTVNTWWINSCLFSLRYLHLDQILSTNFTINVY